MNVVSSGGIGWREESEIFPCVVSERAPFGTWSRGKTLKGLNGPDTLWATDQKYAKSSGLQRILNVIDTVVEFHFALNVSQRKNIKTE